MQTDLVPNIIVIFVIILFFKNCEELVGLS